jgi:hypothetical protein
VFVHDVIYLQILVPFFLHLVSDKVQVQDHVLNDELHLEDVVVVLDIHIYRDQFVQ